MIPFQMYKHAVDRLVKAMKARADMALDTHSPDHQKAIEFEYRDAKRALYDMGRLLITGEVPNKGMK